ncbi:hypothetical protein GQ600_22310 [Phytophthora cactorum]|nr:hypothetical protein GQ600_22310 [Phytophthora cactorum]
MDHELPLAQFESMCSALVINHMTKNLSIALELEPDSDTESRHWWRWLAYGLFSHRARKHSILEHLALDSIIHLSVEDVDNFAAVLSSPYPEELLIGSPRGLIDERDGTLRKHAPIHWQFDEQGQHIEGSGTLMFLIPFVRTFSDDGESEWNNTMVLGCGRRQVQRKDLDFACNTGESDGTESRGITSLKIGFTTDSEVADGLPNLLATVGTPLKLLSLQGRRELLGDDFFLQSCPNVLELRLSGSVVKARIDFRDYRASNGDARLPLISCNWQDVSTLSQELMDPDNLLSKCLREVRIGLATKWLPGAVPRGYDASRCEADLNALLQMHAVNCSLELVDVIVPTMYASYATKFTRFHLQPIDRPLPLPVEVKIAFLSVLEHKKPVKVRRRRTHESFSLSPICKLDQLMLSKILSWRSHDS